MSVARIRGLLIFTLLAAGCGGAENTNPILPPGPGTGGTGGAGPNGTVEVWIDQPTTGSVLGAGTLMDVAAHAAVSNGSDVIDRNSVTASVSTRGASDMLEATQLVFDPSTADLFTGRVSLADLQSGDYTLTVRAKSSGGAVAQSSVDFVIDAGPTLIVKSPASGGHYKNSVVVEVVASDPNGPPELTATIAALPVQLEPVATPPDTYRGSFDFNQPNPPLVGEQVAIVTAVSATGRRVEVRVVFDIDNEGPAITETKPIPGQIAGNVVRISALIRDPAGVLDSSVVAIIGDERTPRFELALSHEGLGVYSALFDTKRLTDCPEPPATGLCIVFPTISFRASDHLGNERTVTYAFAVDNIAPIADLDPPLVRDSKFDNGLRCSWSFDPLAVLGTWSGLVGNMPNDRKMAPQVFDLRARIEDDGNRAEGLKLVPISLVDPDDTAVFVLDDHTRPLVVDTDGNGSCDSINPLLIPTTSPPTQGDQVLKVRLAPVPPRGVSDFTPDPSLPIAACDRGKDPDPPPLLCLASQPTVAIGYAFTEPAIWGVDEVDARHCLGGQFDALANNIGEGWACIAVGTADRNGNFSVSAPLRVYIQYRGVDAPDRDPPASAGPPPSCTGTYDRASKTVTPGACTTQRFQPGGICYKGFDCN